MSSIAIRAEGLSKRYRIGGKQERYQTMRDSLANTLAGSARRVRSLFRPASGSANGSQAMVWALKDVSLEVNEGDVIGIIGRNGAGKSTLLKILSRITPPDEGFAEIHGRVGSLLEVGSGFHPELTGRDNVYLNGAILGMRRAEIDRKFDEIVSFSEIDRFVDTPVKHYSSGMYLRLAFAVAAHLEPEILLIDEVLAVGDVAFQKKCLGKMEDVSKQGRTVLFVSHQLSTITALCGKAVMLGNGRVQAVGQTSEVVADYIKSSGSEVPGELDPGAPTGSGIRFRRLEARDRSGAPIDISLTGQDLDLVLTYETDGNKTVSGLDVALFFSTFLGEPLFVCHAATRNQTFQNPPAAGKLLCRIPRLPLPPGSYMIALWYRQGDKDPVRIDNAMRLTVAGGDYYGTGRLPANKHRGVLIDYEWSLEREFDPGDFSRTGAVIDVIQP